MRLRAVSESMTSRRAPSNRDVLTKLFETVSQTELAAKELQDVAVGDQQNWLAEMRSYKTLEGGGSAQRVFMLCVLQGERMNFPQRWMTLGRDLREQCLERGDRFDGSSLIAMQNHAKWIGQ